MFIITHVDYNPSQLLPMLIITHVDYCSHGIAHAHFQRHLCRCYCRTCVCTACAIMHVLADPEPWASRRPRNSDPPRRAMDFAPSKPVERQPDTPRIQFPGPKGLHGAAQGRVKIARGGGGPSSPLSRPPPPPPIGALKSAH